MGTGVDFEAMQQDLAMSKEKPDPNHVREFVQVAHSFFQQKNDKKPGKSYTTGDFSEKEGQEAGAAFNLLSYIREKGLLPKQEIRKELKFAADSEVMFATNLGLEPYAVTQKIAADEARESLQSKKFTNPELEKIRQDLVDTNHYSVRKQYAYYPEDISGIATKNSKDPKTVGEAGLLLDLMRKDNEGYFSSTKVSSQWDSDRDEWFSRKLSNATMEVGPVLYDMQAQGVDAVKNVPSGMK
jgi:hypothetical protein